MSNIRFLFDNKLDTTGAVITASSTVTAQVSQAQKNGTGSGSCVPGGVYTGTTERTYLIIIDLAGDVGTATFKWSSDGGSTFSGTLVATQAHPLTLDNGITVYFTAATGTDFILGDRWDFKVIFGYGTAKLIDRNRNTEWRSSDGFLSESFSLIQRLGTQTYVLSLASLGSGIVLAGTGTTGQIWKSTDSGATWALIQRLGTQTEVYSLASLGGGIVLAGTAATGQVWKSTDSGATWTLIQQLGTQTHVFSLVSLGSGIVLAGTYPTGQIWKSTDSGATWALIQQLGTQTYVFSLVSLGSGIVLAGTAGTGQIWKSTDSGATWALIQQLGTQTEVYSLASLGGGIVLAGTYPTGQIWRSTDSGATWALIQQLGTQTYVFSLVSLGSGIVLAGTAATGQIYMGCASIVCGFLSPQSIQALIIQDHNFTSTAIMSLMAHTSDAWGAPAFGPVAITWAAGKIDYYLSATQTYQYWRLSITDAAQTDDYLRMSELFLGPYTATTRNFAYNWTRGRAPYMVGSLTGLHPDAVVLGVPEVLMCNFPLLPDADRDTLVDTIFPALYSVSMKRVRPCWIHPDPSVANDAIMGYWEGDALALYAQSPTAYWDLPLQFRELVRAMM